MKEKDLLGTYRGMRDFKATPEPKGKPVKKKSGFRYLIQKHAASHLHYDFRLELDGVLKSWAVPKGPSLKPGDKRLAMQTEDHPLEYGTFEGSIPEGHYGGGTVMLWDEGTWEPVGDADHDFEAGRLKFLIHGKKLQGMWTLVRMHNKETENTHPWLLIKDKDLNGKVMQEVDDAHSVVSHRTMEQIATGAAPASKKTSKVKGKASATQANKAQAPASQAKRQKPPKDISPTLATLIEEVPEGEDWWIETKYDGYRLVAYCFQDDVRLMTRGGKDWTKKFPAIAEALLPFAKHGVILDGELVVENAKGVSDFQKLQNSLSEGTQTGLKYYVFDVPFCAGFDIRAETLLQRRKVLEQLFAQTSEDGAPSVCLSPILDRGGEEIMKEVCKAGWEGIICKRKTSPYGDGKRTRDWVKVKCQLRQEFVIAGYTDPQGTRQQIGALVLGYYKDEVLQYAGHVGTGFTQQTLKDLFKRFTAVKQKASPFASSISDPLGRKPHWLKPILVAEIGFTGWTSDGRLRHPVFKGLREDKPAEEISMEVPSDVSKPKQAKTQGQSKKAQSKRVAGELSHPEKVLFSAAGVTKGDLAMYLQRIAPLMLPHVQNRPLSLMRCPDGDAGSCFYQKHASAGMPSSVHAERVGEEEVLTVDSAEGLVGLVQMGCLEIHPWGAPLAAVEKPDRLVFDLDPGEGVAWPKIVRGAKRIREILQKAGLESFVKTSGGKGLHVVAPLSGGVSDWEFVKNFSHAVANLLAAEDPDTYLATSKKSERAGKIYVDYLRNARGATHVAPYSTRANAQATVSMPLSWDELTGRLKPSSFTVLTLAKHLKGRKDPWEKFFQIRQKIRIGIDDLS